MTVKNRWINVREAELPKSAFPVRSLGTRKPKLNFPGQMWHFLQDGIILNSVEVSCSEIKDNGVGMNIREISECPGHGINGMKERAKIIGAELTISSSAGGTAIVVDYPLRKVNSI